MCHSLFMIAGIHHKDGKKRQRPIYSFSLVLLDAPWWFNVFKAKHSPPRTRRDTKDGNTEKVLMDFLCAVCCPL
jgi:hypothetical protein